MGFSETSKAVEKKYAQAISYFGNEFDLLMHTALDKISAGSTLRLQPAYRAASKG